MVARTLEVVRLGRIRYGEALRTMQARAEARRAGTAPDTLYLLEHEPVITLGRGAKEANILMPREALEARGVDVHEIGRGGDVTYHGPGQIVGYPVLDLRPDRKNVRRYVHDLEEVMIRACAHYGITADRHPEAIGAWVGPTKKIGAIGVRLSRWVTTHGFALNVAADIPGFDLIVPCGLAGKAVTSIERECGKAPPLDAAMDVVLGCFRKVFW